MNSITPIDMPSMYNNQDFYSEFPEMMVRLLLASTKGRASIVLAIPVLYGLLSTLCQGKFKVKLNDDFETHLASFHLAVADSSESKGVAFSALCDPVNDIVNSKNQEILISNEQSLAVNKAIDESIKFIYKKYAKVTPNYKAEIFKEIFKLESQKRQVISSIVLATQESTSSGLIKLLRSQRYNRIGILDPEGRSLKSLIHDPYFQSLLNCDYDGEYINNTTYRDGITYGIRPLISISTLIQHDKLARLTKRQEIWCEGFGPRLNVYFPPSMAGFRLVIGRNYDNDIISWYKDKIEFLINYPWKINSDGSIGSWEKPISDDALDIWKEAALWFENQQGPLSPISYLKPWFGKAPTKVLRHAALNSIFTSDSDPATTPVSAIDMQYGINKIKSEIPATDYLYRLFYPRPESKYAKKIYDYLYSLFGTKIYVTLSDIHRYTHLNGNVSRNLINFFVGNGVLNPGVMAEDNQNSPKYGRPKSQGFYINFDALMAINYNLL